MNAQEQHSNMVRKLAKGGDEILRSLHGRKAHLMHMCIGLTDEYFELLLATDTENLLEELGDVMFYLEGLRFPYENDLGPCNCRMRIAEALCGLQRLVKRHVFYEQDLDCQLLSNAYFSILAWLRKQAEARGWTLDEVRIANMEKLSKRYPNFQYTDERAKERADKAGQD